MPLPIQGMAAAEALTDFFATQGKLPLTLDTTVVPVVSLGELEKDITWGPLACAMISIPAAIGFRSVAEFNLPIGTAGTVGLQASVERIVLSTTAATTFLVAPSPGLPAPTHFADTNWCDTGRRGLPTSIMNGKNDAVLAGAVAPTVRYRLNANITQEFQLRWFVRQAPTAATSQGLFFYPGADNLAMAVSVFWRERLPR